MYWCQYCNQRFTDSRDRDDHENRDACELPRDRFLPYKRVRRSIDSLNYGWGVRYANR